MKTAELSMTTENKLKRIATISASDKSLVFNNIMQLVNKESLKSCYRELEGKKAIGADGITKEQYGEALEENLEALIKQMKQMRYRPGAVREVQIPKAGRTGAFRTLGISNFEDKLVQKMMHKILESIYEPIFLPSSYGFRPGRSCHEAVKGLSEYLYRYDAETVIDVDIANYFSTINQQQLIKILQEKISDERFLRYIARQFKAGILREGELSISEEGVVQGSIVSPILANIYAHYVIDRWIEEKVKPRCRGRVEAYRYCDDLVLVCQYEEDARRIRSALSKRLASYGLALNEEKTRMVRFSKKKQIQGEQQESFDFLGFTFYLGQSKTGYVVPKVKTSGLRMRAKLKRVGEWARQHRNCHKLKEIWRRFIIKLTGHIRYYGVSFNCRHVEIFLKQATKILFKWLNRRSQRRSFSWGRFQLFIEQNPLPKAKIYHKLF